jgi:hypothetical protein
MDNLRRYTSFDQMKADEYQYWQSHPAHERFEKAGVIRPPLSYDY